MRGKKPLLIFLIVPLLFSFYSCGGGGSGSSYSPPADTPGVPYSLTLLPSQSVAQTNSSIILNAKVLDGNGVPVPNVPVTFTNLSEPFGVIKTGLAKLGLIKSRGMLSATVANTNGLGIANVTITSTTEGFATVQAEINSGVGIVRAKKLLLFSSTLYLPAIVAVPQLFLDVDRNASFTSPDDPNDFILFNTSGDNQRYIRATVLFDETVSGKLITFGSDSTDVTYANGANEIEVVADDNGQATVLATVNPSALSQTVKTINITALAADGASNVLTLFLQPLVVAPFPTSFLTASPLSVAVGGKSTITAHVFLQTGGTVPDGTSVNFTASCGTVDPFAQTAGGVANATFTAPTTGGTCTVSGKVAGVSIGSADITVVSALAVTPTAVTVTGESGTGDDVTFTISGGTPPYNTTVLSDNAAVIPNATVVGGPAPAPFTFTVHPNPVASAKTVNMTVIDAAGATVKAAITVNPATSSMALNPSSIEVTVGATITFTIIGGKADYLVYTSDTGVLTITGAIGSNPLSTSGPTFTADTVAEGSATVTVVDSDNNTVTADVTVNAPATPPTPDFTISCAAIHLPASPPGGTGSTTCTVTSLNGFNAAVDLSTASLPGTVTFDSFLPVSPLTPPVNLSTSTILTLNNPGAGGLGAGSYSFSVVGTSGGTLTHIATVTLTVP